MNRILFPAVLLTSMLAAAGSSRASAQPSTDGAAVADAAVAGATAANQATDGALQLRPTILKTFTPKEDRPFGRELGFGMGLELRHFPNRSAWRWGPYVETRYETEGAWRVSGGVLAGYGPFALEVGTEHRTVSDDYAGTTGVTLGKRITFGPLGIGYRLTIPFRDVQPDQGVAMTTRGVEHTLMLTGGWSFDLMGHRPRHQCHHHGRGRN